MTEFNPGDEWREVPAYTKANGAPCLIEFDERGDDVRMWLPVMPPLPTEPGWYARRKTFGALFFRSDGQWITADGVHLKANELGATGDDLELLEPRAVTAKAVLDRVRDVAVPWVGYAEAMGKIARDFGVVS